MDWKLFFTFQDDLPPGAGYDMFGSEHMMWLIFCGLIIACLTAVYVRGQKSLRNRIEFAVALAVLLLQLLQALFFYLTGSYGIYTLPFHICSIASYMVFIHFLTKWEWVAEILFCPCLPGAFLALVFPDWTMYPSLSFENMAGFLVHAGIGLYAALILIKGKPEGMEPGFGKMWISIVFLVVYAACMIPFDLEYAVNYGFLNVPAPGSPLEIIWKYCGGRPGYYAGYAAFALCIIVFQHGLFIIVKKSLRNSHFRQT